MKKTRLQDYLDEEGRITRWPARRHKGDVPLLLDYLAAQFEIGRLYNEREVNEILIRFHTFEDWALLRRELFERGYLNRVKDGTSYWRTPETRLY